MNPNNVQKCPSNNLWVKNLPSDVTHTCLINLFGKHGFINGVNCYASNNYALVCYKRLDDAVNAKISLDGSFIGRNQIIIDFAQPEQSNFPEMGDAQFRGMDQSLANPDVTRNHIEPNHSEHERPQSSQLHGRKEGQPSKVLWVGYPSSVVINEEMLHNAMILFGEIEGIKCFPARNYSFVEFRSVDEARRAKEGLEGRLFNNPRISIRFSNSDLAPAKGCGALYNGFRGFGADVFVPFRPPLMATFPLNRGIAPNNFPAIPAPNGLLVPGVPRPFGPRGSFEPQLKSSYINDQSHSITPTPLILDNRKMSPPANGLLPAPGVPGRASLKTKKSGWDVLDSNQPAREPKRSRIEDLGLFNGHPSSTVGRRDEYFGGSEQPYGGDTEHIGQPLPMAHPNSGFSPADSGIANGMPCANEDFIWRGVIAKGGSYVCNARCIPIGKGLQCPLPEVVDCSARTGLDMLTKHYAGAIGFDMVFFLPDSEKDFAPYTEFIRYLGSKNRAGVAKLNNFTTLFLVPPSKFLTDVLKVAGQERLYGVVLRLPQQLPSPKKEPTIHMDNVRPAPAESFPPAAPSALGSLSQDQSNDNISTSRPGVELTPELIASLATLLPAKAQAPVGQSAQPQKGVLSQGWSQHPQVLDQTRQSSQQYNNQFYSDAKVSVTFQPSSASLNSSSHQSVIYSGSIPNQNPIYNLQDQGPVSSALSVHSLRPQQIVPSTQEMQPNHFSAVNNTHDAYRMVHRTHAGSYGLADNQQLKCSNSNTNQFHGGNLLHSENTLPNPSANMNVEPINQAGKLQGVPSEVGKVAEEIEADKNKRYQSTLQFAANLLLQIQQHDQQLKQEG